MPLIEMLTDISSFNYEKVGTKQGEYFGEDKATGFTPNRNTFDATEFKNNAIQGLTSTNFIDLESNFSTGEFIQNMATKESDFKLENETFGDNLVSIDYSRLQKARQGKATNKPNQTDFHLNVSNTFDGEEGKFNTEYRVRAEEPGFFARLFGGTSEIGAMYEKFNGNKGLRTGNFGFDEPFIIKEVGDSYFSSELDDGIFRGGLALNVVRTLEDTTRLAKWALTGRGIIWNLKQAVLQAQQPILQNRIFNPAGVIGSIVPGVHLPRHTGGTFFDFENPPVYDTTPNSVNFEIPKVEEKEGFGLDDIANSAIGFANSALGALGIIGEGRKVNRLTGLYQSRIVEGGGEPESKFSILGSLGIGNNEFEDPQRKVNSTKGPFGKDIVMGDDREVPK